jgi:hypothetical protein
LKLSKFDLSTKKGQEIEGITFFETYSLLVLHDEPFYDEFAFVYMNVHSKTALPVRVGHEYNGTTEVNEVFEVLTGVVMKSSIFLGYIAM